MIACAYVDRHVLTENRMRERKRVGCKRNAASAGKCGEENETREHTAASSSSVRPGLPSALQLNPTPLRPSGALRLHSFSSGISLNGSRNLERTPDPTATLLPRSPSSSPRPFLHPAFPSRIKTSGFISFFPRSPAVMFLSRSILLSFCLLPDRCTELEAP